MPKKTLRAMLTSDEEQEAYKGSSGAVSVDVICWYD